MNLGLNMLVEVTPAELPAERGKSVSHNSITVIGLIDTGATNTSIDHVVADYLGLIPVGKSEVKTAKGLSETPDYNVNLIFTGLRLQPRPDMRVGSCDLSFNLNDAHDRLQNTGLVIGRDIMAKWNIVWHGPTSTVFISD